jgi:hypothetical protein
MNRRACGIILAAISLIGLTNCSNSPTKVTPKIAIAATSGTPQSATVGAAFAAPLVATVTTGGTPTPSVTVTFAAPASGASGTFAGGANTAVTNASGVATSAVFTANTKSGAYTVTASVAGAQASASFSLTNNAGPAASISVTSGSGQSATVSTAFAAPLVATVQDSNQNPVSGVTVTFAAPGSGASGTFAGGANTAVTNSSGVATSAVFTANATVGGPYTVAATVSGVATPANFTLTNTAAVETVTATSGTPQSATISTAFAAPLVATVKTGATPDSGLVVTFTAPASGASGTFADSGTNVTTATTNASGVATSAVFTANATAGGPYNVVTTAPGAAAPANFSLTNTAVVAGTTNYVFYLSGADDLPNNTQYNFYALAGAITVKADGTVTGGEQDYNDAFGFTSPEPSGDTITGGTLTVNSSTGQGTLTLITNNSSLGVNGTETFGIQFANTSHALIMQFDGSATSSGSMDVQSTPAAPSGNYAFSYSGVDSSYNPRADGGVFSVSGGVISNGVIDQNDSGVVVTNVAWTGAMSAPDAFGRGTLSANGNNALLNYYEVNPKVARIINVDTDESSVGSAYSQGAGGFTNASLPSPSVFTEAGNPWGTSYGVLGMLTTSGTGSNPAHFAGVADNNQMNGSPQMGAAISGTYTIGANGHGSLTIPSGLTSVSALGIYMVDPTININDPNNAASGQGGALVVALDGALAGGGGVLVPQTSTSTAAFTGKYAVGWQNFNTFSGGCGICQFDMVGLGTVTGGAISGTGLVSDPFQTLGLSGQVFSGATISGTPPPDGSHPGRYGLFSLAASIGGTNGTFHMVIYQASGGQLFWMEVESNNAVSVGPLEQQGSLTGLPAARKGSGDPDSKLGQ